MQEVKTQCVSVVCFTKYIILVSYVATLKGCVCAGECSKYSILCLKLWLLQVQ